MVGHRAVRAPGEVWRAATHDGHARGVECAALGCIERRRVADAAQMLPAGFDGAAVFLRLAQRRIVPDDQHRSGDELARNRGTRGLAIGRSDRQAERQNHREWWGLGRRLSSGWRSQTRGMRARKSGAANATFSPTPADF